MTRNQTRRPQAPETTDPRSLDRNAFALILTRLGRRDHTEAELRRALARKGFREPAVESAIHRARGEGLVDDARLAGAVARLTARSGKRGPRRLVATLRRKGVSTEIARAAAKEAFAQSDEAETNLIRFATRLLERARGKTLNERRIKAVRSLLGRGFDLGEARRVLRIAETALMIENSRNDADPDQ